MTVPHSQVQQLVSFGGDLLGDLVFCKCPWKWGNMVGTEIWFVSTPLFPGTFLITRCSEKLHTNQAASPNTKLLEPIFSKVQDFCVGIYKSGIWGQGPFHFAPISYLEGHHLEDKNECQNKTHQHVQREITNVPPHFWYLWNVHDLSLQF